MNAILEQINSTGKIFVEFAPPMLVQSSVLILILLLADFALRKKLRAVFRYWIWLLVLLKLLLPTSLSSPMSLGYFLGEGLAYVDISQTTTEAETMETTQANVSPIIETPHIEASRHTSAVAPIIPDIESVVAKPINSPVVSVTPVTWQGAVFLVWLIVVMAMGLLLLQRAIFVRGLVAQAKEANGFMADTLESCCRSMRVKRKIGLKVSANATSPAVCGLFRPVILVPQNLTSSLSASQLQAVMLHELAHIRRGDLWVNLAQTFLQIIYFYNPLLWLANCVIRRVREQAVDEMVLVAMGEKARQYPQTLVSVAKLAFKRPALSLRLIGVVESKSALAGRIKHILNRPMPKKAKLGILGLAVVIIAAAILLPMATCTPGPPSLVIKGTVKDAQTGEPIAGARVFDDGYGPKPDWEQIKANERFEWGAITNSAGEYSFLTWPEHHSIKVEAPGYKAERQSLYDGHFVFNKKDEEIFDFALEPEEVSDSSEFKTTLPNGVTVELIGICEHPSEGKKWWKPDGTELSKDDIRVRTRGGIGASGIPYNVAVKVTMPEDATFKWGRIKGATGGISLEALDSEDGPISNMRAFRIYIDEKLTATSIHLGVATGPWKTRARNRSKGSISTAGIVFSKAYESDGGVRIIVADEHLDLDYRIAAIDTQGKEHLFHQRGGSAGKVRQTTAFFHDIKLNQIEYFLFQTRPYQWCEFKNVSLQPGVKTDVQVEEVGAGNKAGQSPFAATLSNGVTVELVGICEHPSKGKQWWRPDGQPLGEFPYKVSATYAKSPNEKILNVIMAISPKGPAYSATKLEFSQGNPRSYWVCLESNDKVIKNWRAGGLSVPLTLEKTDVKVGIAGGPWQKMAKVSPQFKEPLTEKTNLGQIQWLKSLKENGSGDLIIYVANNFTNKADSRLIAVDITGKEHFAYSGKGEGIADRMTNEYKFHLSPNQVRELFFIVRPYQWVTFKNVSLKPDFKTDVQVEGGKADDKAQIENAIRQLWTAIEANDIEKVAKLGPQGTFAYDNFDITNWVLKQAEEKKHILTERSRDLAEPDDIWIRGDEAIALKKMTRWYQDAHVYFFVRLPDSWTLYTMDRRLSTLSVSQDYLFRAWPRTSLDNKAWVEYSQAADLLHKGANRAELARRFSSIGRRYAVTRQGRLCAELGILLARMVEKDKSFIEPVDLQSFPTDEQINYYIFKLRDVAEQEMTVPGKCRVLFYPKTPNSPAVALRNMGRAVIPAMISLLDDRRPTRSVGVSENGGVVLRYCDVALEIIEAISGQKFDKRTERSAFLSTADETTRSGIISRAKARWHHKNEVQVEDEGAWGKPIEDAQICLLNAVQIWGRSDWPHPSVQLRLWARNEGERYLHLPENGLSWQIEVDGLWYEWVVPKLHNVSADARETVISRGGRLLDFNPGDSHAELTVNIASDWLRIPKGKQEEYARRRWFGWAGIDDEYGRELVFKSGLHRVRVAVTCPPSRAGHYSSVRLVSNPLKIAITEIGGNAPFLPGAKPDVQVEGEKPQSLIFHGLDLTAVPHTTNSSRLPDLFEERPLGSKSYHIQKDVTPIYSGLDGTVYFIPRRNIFYVQHDKLGSSTLTYYGPFEGNPVQILNLQPDVQVITRSTIEPIGKHALSFDGVNDCLHVAANSTLTLKSPFTIEMWLKPDYSEIQRTEASKEQWRRLALMRKGKRLFFQEKRLQAGGFMMFVGPPGPSSQPDGKCSAGLYLANAKGQGYQVDGFWGDRLQPARPGWLYVSMSCTRETYIPVTDQPLIIGENIVPSGFPFKGQIAEIRIWAGVSSRDQVTRYNNKPLKGNEPGLVACWDFKRPGGQVVYDIGPNGNHARLGGSEGPDDADPKWVDLKAASHQPDQKPDVQVERETNNRAELNAAPVEIQAIGKVLKEWFENCAAGDLEEVKKAYLPSVNKKAERDLQQIERFLEVVPDWQFSLLGVMWDGNKATAVSNVLKGLKDPAAIISGPVVWICHLNKLDGQWRLANNVVGERMEIVQPFITQAKQKNPNLRIWPENFSTHLFQETNVLKKEAKVFEEGHWEQLDGAPKEVQDIGEVLRRWFGGCLAGDLEQVKATYTPNNRRRAEKQLKEIREHMTMTPADWQFSPMIIKIGDSRAEAISHEFVITFNHPENTGDPAVLIVHLMKVDAQWGILYSSGDLLRNVSYAHFKRKYPQSQIWFDKSIPDWLKPDQQTKTDISIEDITSSVPEIKAEQTLAEKLRELNNDKAVFESYFPDSVEGGKALDDWWQRRSKDPDIDNKIFSMVRYGLRMDGKGNPRKYNRDLYVKWIGQKYIWKKGPKNKQAVELMYYASFDPGLTGDVVYNGLSVAGPEQNPKILKRLVDICMIDTSVTRILWGTKGKHDRMIEYLEPYLNSLDQQIRQRAIILEKAFKGEIDYGQWEKEQYRKKRQEEFGDQLSQIREVLLKGNSKQRSEMFGLIKRKGLYILVDDSFKEPLIACLKDDHPVVKEAALRLSGGVLLKKNEQSPEIFELMSNLSRDWDHKVRNEAAKFIGIHWIWGAKPQKPEAIEIMLRLSKDKDRGVRYQAVYYGLSVVENKDERIVKRLVEMAFDKTNDFGRISWGLGYGADKEMIKKYLKPYIDIKSKKGELARQLYKEIFKEELPEI